jgi:hypothetical protein
MMKKLSSSYMILIVILGGITITTVLADAYTIGTYPYTIQDGSNNQRLVITSSGNVGIGTSSPTQPLTVAGNIMLSGDRSVIVTEGDNPTTDVGGVQFLTYDNGVDNVWTPTDKNGNPLNSNIHLGGFNYYNNNLVNLLVSGNVGIGTPSPAEKLDVAGNIRLTGNIVSPNDICIGSC